MTTDYSFMETFATKVSEPDVFDGAGAAIGGADQFFTELGKIAKAIQDKTLTAADAQAAKATLLKFSDGLNRLNARIAQAGGAVGNAQDANFKAFFGKLVTNTHLAIQQVSYAADEIAAGNSASIQKLGSAVSTALKNVGGFLGLLQIGNEFKENGLTAVGVDKAGEKALGVLTGLAGGEAGALLGGAAAAAIGAPVVVVAAAAIGGAVVVGYFAGKAGESLWQPFRHAYEQQFLTSVFDAGSSAYNTIATGLSDWSIRMGKFDGTWLQGLEGVSNEEKAGFTTLISGVAKIPATPALNADILKLFAANFSAESLASRDQIIQVLFSFAKENGYVAERITVNEANVTLDLPSFPSLALVGVRDFAQKQLSPFDQRGWALTGPERIVIALGAGTHAASANDSLIVGSAGVDGLIGGAGNDDLIGGAGQDTLLGMGGTDDLYGGADNDLLDGGAGGDRLYGGAGNDTYQLKKGELGDIIFDEDGNGTVTIDGQTLTGGKKAADNYWLSDDKQWGYFLNADGDLTVSNGTSPDKITIRGWKNGGGNQLGIVLSDEEAEKDPEPQNTLNGDLVAKTEKNEGEPLTRTNAQGESVAVVAKGQPAFVIDGEGNLVAGANGVQVTDNTLYGSAGNDKINGLTGNDLLSGGAGNDHIDGGAGNDMIGGGLGNDTIQGGEGNDFISSSADILPGRQQLGPNDLWENWGKPAGATLTAGGAMWGVYPQPQVIIWNGIAGTRFDAQSDVIDGGAGDDWVMASWGNDRVKGGEGNDNLDGLAGNDVLEGGAGDDDLDGDGIVKSGYLNTVGAASHGNDFIDGGEGNDSAVGGGGADDIFGGDGADNLYGDTSNKTDSEFFVAFDHHGGDYLDGEGGDDYLEGGGGNDTLYGGEGNDALWGDQTADRLQGDDATHANAWGNDYLDGEAGDDQLTGGGRDDTLFGGDSTAPELIATRIAYSGAGGRFGAKNRPLRAVWRCAPMRPTHRSGQTLTTPISAFNNI